MSFRLYILKQHEHSLVFYPFTALMPKGFRIVFLSVGHVGLQLGEILYELVQKTI